MRNCWFKNIKADTIEREAIRINMMYTGGNRLPERKVNAGTPVIENIHYENIQCKYAKRNVIQIIGIPEMPVKNITLKNIKIKGRTGIEIRDAENISLNNLSISNEKGTFMKVAYSENIAVDTIRIENTDADEVPFLFKDVENSSLKNVIPVFNRKMVEVYGSSESLEFDKSIRR